MELLVSLDVTMDFLVWRMHTMFAVICAGAFGDVYLLLMAEVLESLARSIKAVIRSFTAKLDGKECLKM